jgi:hypothetical protein
MDWTAIHGKVLISSELKNEHSCFESLNLLYPYFLSLYITNVGGGRWAALFLFRKIKTTSKQEGGFTLSVRQ